MYKVKTLALLVLSGCLLLAACGEERSQDNQTARSSAESQNIPSESITSQQVLKASLDGNVNLIEEAVRQSVDISQSDESGRTPLMLASFNGHSDVVKLLLENGADPEKTDNQGQTALTFAASGPYPQTVKLLLENDADPNHTDTKEGWSALMWAAAEGNEQVVKVLLDHGADPDLRDKDDETARYFAEASGHQNVAELIKEAEGS